MKLDEYMILTIHMRPDNWAVNISLILKSLLFPFTLLVVIIL